MRAGIVPDGSAGFKADIPQRADGGAAAAGDALVSGIKGFGSDKPLIVRLETVSHFFGEGRVNAFPARMDCAKSRICFSAARMTRSFSSFSFILK